MSEGMTNAQMARAIIREIQRGCGDHSCAIRRPTGMGTNGGCRCRKRVEDLLDAGLYVYVPDDHSEKGTVKE